jgi:hypothetical protein
MFQTLGHNEEEYSRTLQVLQEMEAIEGKYHLLPIATLIIRFDNARGWIS